MGSGPGSLPGAGGILRGPKPAAYFTLKLADFGDVLPDLPGQITLQTETPKMELRLAYQELRLNPPLSPADLTLRRPPGWRWCNSLKRRPTS